MFDTYQDPGYPMWFGGMREIFNARPGFELVSIEGLDNPLDFDVFGEPIHFNKFEDVIAFELDGKNPAGMGGLRATRSARRLPAAALRWVTFEAPVEVTVNGETRPLTIKPDHLRHRPRSRAAQEGPQDERRVRLQRPLYIGCGLLDPSRPRPTISPGSYQILNMNGCVSYNYYEKDYWPLKLGGTKGLDIITNGLELGDGERPGDGSLRRRPHRWPVEQLSGPPREEPVHVLRLRVGHGRVRVVDGELDNTYTPAERSRSRSRRRAPPRRSRPASDEHPARVKNDDATH